MSAPLAVELERELGAAPRQFATVASAVLWYAASRATKEGTRNLWNRGQPCSADARARAVMTYSRIVACLSAEHHADYPDEPLAVNAIDAIQRGRTPKESPPVEAARRVEEFCAWCIATGRSETSSAFLAERLDFKSAEGCSSYMRYTARVLRRRFVAVGLLVEGD